MTKVNAAVDTKRGRFYPWDGSKYVSVTTAISEGVPKHGLNAWKLRSVAELAARNRKKLATFTRIPDAKEWLLDKFFKGTDNSAANLGSTVHAMCEQLALGNEVEDTEQTKPYTDSFREFLSTYQPEVLHTEVTVYSRTHGYAGTADSFLRIGKKVYVVDIKTGKGVWPEAALQLSAYRFADFYGKDDGTEGEIPKCHGGLVLHVRPDGCHVLPVVCDENVFDTYLSALDIFRWNAIEGENTIGEAWSRD